MRERTWLRLALVIYAGYGIGIGALLARLWLGPGLAPKLLELLFALLGAGVVNGAAVAALLWYRRRRPLAGR
jgi:hypothetical protein